MNYEMEPVFIVGSPRSGTTAMTQVIRILDDQYFLPATEGHFLYLMLGELQRMFQSPNLFQAARSSVAIGAGRNLDTLQSALADSINHIYHSIAAGEGIETAGRNWVDKTPDVRQMKALPFLLELFPKAKVILLHRHPLEILLSTVKNWDIQDADRRANIAERWTELHSFFRAEVKPLIPEENLCIIRQENIQMRMDETISNILDTLGTSGRDEKHARIRQFLRNNEVNRTQAFKGGAYDLKSHATTEDYELIETVCGDEMKRWGYSL